MTDFIINIPSIFWVVLLLLVLLIFPICGVCFVYFKSINKNDSFYEIKEFLSNYFLGLFSTVFIIAFVGVIIYCIVGFVNYFIISQLSETWKNIIIGVLIASSVIGAMYGFIKGRNYKRLLYALGFALVSPVWLLFIIFFISCGLLIILSQLSIIIIIIKSLIEFIISYLPVILSIVVIAVLVKLFTNS